MATNTGWWAPGRWIGQRPGDDTHAKVVTPIAAIGTWVALIFGVGAALTAAAAYITFVHLPLQWVITLHLGWLATALVPLVQRPTYVAGIAAWAVVVAAVFTDLATVTVSADWFVAELLFWCLVALGAYVVGATAPQALSDRQWRKTVLVHLVLRHALCYGAASATVEAAATTASRQRKSLSDCAGDPGDFVRAVPRHSGPDGTVFVAGATAATTGLCIWLTGAPVLHDFALYPLIGGALLAIIAWPKRRNEIEATLH